jgi:signal transduction histidine kinase
MADTNIDESAEVPGRDSFLERNALVHRANRAYLTTVAHELKTPLTIISGYIEILLDGKLGSLSQDQEWVLIEAAANCERLKKFVGEYLSLEALERAKVRMRFELASFNQCLSDVCCYWRRQSEAKSVALYFNPDAAIDRFFFDYDKIQHIVSNLLDNAVRFTPSCGSIWVATHGTRLETSADGDGSAASGIEGANPDTVPAVKVVVADTGPGIPAEFHTEVFSEFFKIPNQQGSPSGSGLGLSIAKRMTQLHGGRIWVECEPGAGTRVCFLIPVRQKTQVDEHSEEDGYEHAT